jgi:hypothetical protein
VLDLGPGVSQTLEDKTVTLPPNGRVTLRFDEIGPTP